MSDFNDKKIKGIKPQGKSCTRAEFADSRFPAPEGRGTKPFVSSSLGRSVKSAFSISLLASRNKRARNTSESSQYHSDEYIGSYGAGNGFLTYHD